MPCELPPVRRRPTGLTAILLCACLIGGCASSPNDKAAGTPDTGGPIERAVRAEYLRVNRGNLFSAERRESCAKADAGDLKELRDVADSIELDTGNGLLSEQIYLRGLALGDPASAMSIAEMYWTGTFGHPKDLQTAAWYYEAAAYLPLLPDESFRTYTMVQSALHAAALYAFEIQPNDEERLVGILKRIRSIDPRHTLTLRALETLRPAEFPRPRNVSAFQTEPDYWSNQLAIQLRNFRQSADQRIDSDKFARESLARDAAFEEASRRRTAELLMTGITGIGSSVVQGQQQLDASRNLNAHVRATGTLPGSNTPNRATGNAATGNTPPYLAGGTGQAPPVTPLRMPLSMRDAYLEAARKCREGAARATNDKVRADYERCAAENQRLADQLLSNAPAVRVGG